MERVTKEIVEKNYQNPERVWEMLEEIRKDGSYKKSMKIAYAIAKDYNNFYSSTDLAHAMQAELGTLYRRRRNGEDSVPGCYLNIKVFRSGWKSWRSENDAQTVAELMKKSIDRPDGSETKVTSKNVDMGVLETLHHLFYIGADLANITEAYVQISRNLKYGI